MRLRETEISVPKFLKELLQLSHHAKLPEVVEANEDLNDLSVKRRVDLHGVEEIGETAVLVAAHLIERVRHTPADVLYAGQGVRNGIGGVVDVKVAVVLPEPAGDDANAKAPPPFVLGLCDAILVAFGGVT